MRASVVQDGLVVGGDWLVSGLRVLLLDTQPWYTDFDTLHLTYIVHAALTARLMDGTRQLRVAELTPGPLNDIVGFVSTVSLRISPNQSRTMSGGRIRGRDEPAP